ncbi:hypothetical protein C8R44DRAFT_732068 [Mycena epipterygia]|nr:hypothetical protein C8R44DRAFT_732068 [Mycena epipterygia]
MLLQPAQATPSQAESTSIDSGVRQSRVADSTQLNSSRLRGVESGVAATLVESQTHKIGHCMSRMPESCEVVQEFPGFYVARPRTGLRLPKSRLLNKTRRIFSTSQSRVITPTCTASAKFARPTPARIGGPGSQGGRTTIIPRIAGGAAPRTTTHHKVFRTASSARHGPRHESHNTCAARSNSYIRGLRPTLTRSSSTVDVKRMRAPLRSTPSRPQSGVRRIDNTFTAPLLQSAPPDGRASTPEVRFLSTPFIPHESLQSTPPRTTTPAIRTPAARAMRDGSAPAQRNPACASTTLRSACAHAYTVSAPQPPVVTARRAHKVYGNDGAWRARIATVAGDTIPAMRICAPSRVAAPPDQSTRISVHTPSGSARIPPAGPRTRWTRMGLEKEQKKNKERGEKEKQGKIKRIRTILASHPSSTSPSLSTDSAGYVSQSREFLRGSTRARFRCRCRVCAVEMAEEGEEEDKIVEKTAKIRVGKAHDTRKPTSGWVPPSVVVDSSGDDATGMGCHVGCREKERRKKAVLMSQSSPSDQRPMLLPAAFYSVVYAPQLAASRTPPCAFCSQRRLVVRCPRTLPASYSGCEVDTSLDGAKSHSDADRPPWTRIACTTVHPPMLPICAPDPRAQWLPTRRSRRPRSSRAYDSPRQRPSAVPLRLDPPASRAQSRAHPSSWTHTPPRVKWHAMGSENGGREELRPSFPSHCDAARAHAGGAVAHTCGVESLCIYAYMGRCGPAMRVEDECSLPRMGGNRSFVSCCARSLVIDVKRGTARRGTGRSAGHAV